MTIIIALQVQKHFSHAVTWLLDTNYLVMVQWLEGPTSLDFVKHESLEPEGSIPETYPTCDCVHMCSSDHQCLSSTISTNSMQSIVSNRIGVGDMRVYTVR